MFATLSGQAFRSSGGRNLFYEELFRKLLIIQVERKSEGLVRHNSGNNAPVKTPGFHRQMFSRG